MNPIAYSIVVPVFNSEKTIEELCERIDSILPSFGGGYEIILVDDGSSDNSWFVLQKLHRKNPRIKIIRLMKNFGQDNALLCGFQHALGDYIITLDDDLQNPPEEIPKLIAAIKGKSADVIFGVPREKKHSWIKNAGSYGHRRVLHMVFKHHPKIKVSSFRIIRREILNFIIQNKTPNPRLTYMLFEGTERIGSIEVEHHSREIGKTTYTMSKLIRLFLDAVLYYSTIPLKGVFWLGVSAILLSFFLGSYYLIQYWMRQITVEGWMTLVLLLLFFSGSIMFSLGIIGEYLLRIVQEVGRTPQFLIREKEL